MDAFNLLKADHQKVAELFEQLERTNGKRKLTVFKQIKTELDLHAQIEEKIFYPALEKPAQTRDLTMEAYEEHEQVKTLLRELSRGRTANEEWLMKAKVLQENVEHHVQEEENQLFKKASAALSREEIEELGARLENEKARKQGRQGARTSAGKSSAKASARKTSGKASASKSSGKSSGAKKSASSKKTGSKKKPASKAAKKRSGSKKSAGSKSARAAK